MIAIDCCFWGGVDLEPGFFPVFASLKLIPFLVNPIVLIQRSVFFQAKLMFFQHEICMNENIMEIFLVGKSNIHI